LLSISWSNVDFTEKSGAILARVMDHNFNRMHEQIERLEKELAEVRSRLGNGLERSEPNSEASAMQETGLACWFSVSSGND
jgi:DNA-binding transcriptional MocR family regulator